MFCILNTGHVIILLRTVNLRLNSHAYVCIIYEETKFKFPWDLFGENKTYKPKRSIICLTLESVSRNPSLPKNIHS